MSIRIIRSLPYSLVTAFSLTAGFVWIDSIYRRQYVSCFDINRYNEAVPEAIIFMTIGIIGVVYLLTEARKD